VPKAKTEYSDLTISRAKILPAPAEREARILTYWIQDQYWNRAMHITARASSSLWRRAENAIEFFKFGTKLYSSN
jgi:hypothetical protein